MPFLYKFVIDNKEVDVEMGFTTSRKWEEALDEASLVVPFSIENKDPEKMFSLLEVEIIEIDNYIDRNIVEIKNKEYLIFSDKVENVGNYGYYRHNLSAIEYTAKLDVYFINQLAKSRTIMTNQLAPFEHNLLRYGYIGSKLEMLKVYKNYYENHNITFDKVDKALVIDMDPDNFRPVDMDDYDPYNYRDTVIKTNAPLISGSSPHILSNSSANWVFPKGKWEIEYGFIATEDDWFAWDTTGFKAVYKFYIEVIDAEKNTMYDVVNEIRDMISKFGGIEDTIYYDSTRVFNIDDEFKELLKNTQAPQIYLNTATARQILIYVLSFVNALPRLKYGSSIDTLTLEQYNLDTGNFVIEDIVGRGSQQNTNQIGTRNYQAITQGLSSDLDDPSIVTPSHNQFQSVRSLDIQVTDNNFGIKLPQNSPLYMPIKLVVQIPKVELKAKDININVTKTLFEQENFELDLTNRFINSEEWKLKEITPNFLSIESKNPFDENIGYRNWKVENLQWFIGDTIIKLSDIYGEIFKENLIKNVVKIAIYEYFTLNYPNPLIILDEPVSGTNIYLGLDPNITITFPSNYKEWKFRLEYISDERLVIKQDKEDLSQIDFYSEMRQNQEESLVNIVRQSKKAYGDLQRTGNILPLFTKKHESLSEFYKEGQKDKNGFTITQVDTQWFNDYALATYYVTKHHNRIQQATFINQAYRPFDNFTKNALNRHEYYGDYLIVVPPNYENLIQEPTKIYSNDRTIRQISNILLGKKPKLNSSVSTALIRTDGMLEENPDNNGKINFISTPVTSRGIKGGFTFTFGFESNMVAGDGLVKDENNNNWYNQAVRYTDTKGRFSRFGFTLHNELKLYDANSYNDYPLVKVPHNEVFEDDEETNFQKSILFSCGYPNSVDGFVNSLVFNKDPLTNVNLTYGLNVLSYEPNLYVFGSKFFTDNFLVRTHTKDEIDNYETPILYRYQYGSDVKYNMFDDLYVKKPNIATPITLSSTYVEFDSETNEIKFKNISFSATNSWAIGIPRKNSDVVDLLVACNEGINGLKFVEKHFRPNVREIGKKKVVTIETIEKSFCDEITYKITNTTNQKVSVYVNLISIGYLEIGESILRTTSHNLSGIGGEINKFIVFVGLNDLETTEYSYTEIIPKECIIK